MATRDFQKQIRYNVYLDGIENMTMVKIEQARNYPTPLALSVTSKEDTISPIFRVLGLPKPQYWDYIRQQEARWARPDAKGEGPDMEVVSVSLSSE